MANYHIGTLALDLKIDGESSVQRALHETEKAILEADKAGQSLYAHNRKGFAELKTLANNAAPALSKLEEAFRRGDITAEDYSRGLETISRVADLAVRGSASLSRQTKDLVNQLNSSRRALDDFNAGTLKIVSGTREASRAVEALDDRLEELGAEYYEAAAAANEFANESEQSAARSAAALDKDTAAVKANADARKVAAEVPPPSDPPGGGSAPSSGGDEPRRRRAPVAEVPNEALTKLKEYERRLLVIDSLHRAGETPTRKFKQQLDELGDEAMETASKFDKLSDEYLEYISVAGKAGAIKGRVNQASLRDSYFSRQFILGNALSNMYGELGIRAFDLAANTVRSFDDMSLAWEKSVDIGETLREVVASTGTSMQQVTADVEFLTDKYMTLASAGEGAAAALLAGGVSPEQAKQMLDAVGASALDAGQSVEEAFMTIAQSGGDIEGALLSATGATERYENALLSAAAGQSEMVDSLSQAERQQALYEAVMGSSAKALLDYGDNTDEIAGAQMRQGKAASDLRMTLGEELAPTVLRTTEMFTRFIGVVESSMVPLANAADAVGSFVGSLTGAETLLIGLAVLGPRAFTVMANLPKIIGAIGVALGTVLRILGGWPAIFITTGIAAYKFFNRTKNDADALGDSLDVLDSKMSDAFSSLDAAKGPAGLKTAVAELAETMKGDAKTAFEQFAETAITTSETTTEAIDKIYNYLAQRRIEAVEGALATVESALGPISDTQDATVEFNTTGAGTKLAGLREQAAGLEADIAGVQDQVANGLEPWRGVELIEPLEMQLASVRQSIAEIEQLGTALGAASPAQSAQLSEEQKALLAERDRLRAELKSLRNKPVQTMRNKNGNNESDADGDGVPDKPIKPVDQFAEYRGALNVARAELNLLRAEHERLGTDASYEALEAGLQAYLGSVGVLQNKLQGVHDAGKLSQANQVEMINLLAEEAALRAEIVASPNVERERKAGEYVGGLTTRVDRGTLNPEVAMDSLSDAANRVRAELAALGDYSALTDEQQAQFEMLVRLLEQVETGIGSVQEKLQARTDASTFVDTRNKILELMAAGRLIPENLLSQMQGLGVDAETLATWERYNELTDENLTDLAELVRIQEQLAASGAEAARAQRIAGDDVTPLQNRIEALQEAISLNDELVRNGSPEAAASAESANVGLEAELMSLLAARDNAEALAERLEKVAEQAGFTTQGFAAMDAAQARMGQEGSTNLEILSARLSTARDNLQEAVLSFGEASPAAAAFRAEVERLAPTVEQMVMWNERMGAPNLEAVIATQAYQMYDTLAEAMRALGLTAQSTGPLVDELNEIFDKPGLEKAEEQYKRIAEAIETIRFALENDIPLPKWATDVLAEEGVPNSFGGPNGVEVDTKAIRDANMLMRDYEDGLLQGPSLVDKIRQEEIKLLDARDATNASTAEGQEELLKIQRTLERLRGLMREQSNIDFQIALVESGEANPLAFIQFANDAIADLEAKQAAIWPKVIKGNVAAQQAWNAHMVKINLLKAAMTEVMSPTKALADGFANMGSSLRAAGMDGAATAVEALSGVFQGLDLMLKGGSITDGIAAIGAAFSASEDEGLQAMGNLLTGAANLAAGIASGDWGAILGGALGLLTGIIDIFTAGAKALAEAMQKVKEYEEKFSIVDGEGGMTARARTDEEYRKSQQRGYDIAASDGVVWPWESYEIYRDSNKPIEEENKDLIAAFDSIEGSLKGLLKEKILAYIEDGNMEGFKEGVEEAVIEGLLDGFIASKAFQEVLGKPINEVVKLENDEKATQAQRDKAWDNLMAATDQATNLMTEYGDRLRERKTGEGPQPWDAAGAFGDDAMALAIDFKPGDTSPLEQFKQDFGESLRDHIAKKLIEAFMVSAAIKPMLDELGQYVGEALEDGVLDAAEQRMIDSLVNGVVGASAPLAKALSGLYDDGSDIRIDVDSAGLAALNAEYERLSDPALLHAEVDKLDAEKEKNDLLLQELQIKKALVDLSMMEAFLAGETAETVGLLGRSQELQAEIDALKEQNKLIDDQIAKLPLLNKKDRDAVVVNIKAELGIDQKNIKGDIASAFDAGTYEDFLDEFGKSMKDMLKKALIESFLTSGPMAKAIEQLSNEAFNAFRDGKLTPEEEDRLLLLGENITEQGESFYKMLEDLGLIAKDYTKLTLDELYRERGGEDRKEVEDEIRVRLGVDLEALKSGFASAFDAATFEDFQKAWAQSFKDVTKNALITAFMETAAMKAIFDELGAATVDALADDVITPEEFAGLEGLSDEAQGLAERFYKVLEALGLVGEKVQNLKELSLAELYDLDTKESIAEIKVRLKIDPEQFGSTLAGAFDAANIEEFREKLRLGVKESVRDALITAFLESAAIKPLLDALSAGVLDAMEDGELSDSEREYIMGLQESLGLASEDFFKFLDEVGLGFSDLSESLDGVTESLTNVPAGFRVAQERYLADDPSTQPGDGKKDPEYEPVQPRDPKERGMGNIEVDDGHGRKGDAADAPARAIQEAYDRIFGGKVDFAKILRDILLPGRARGITDLLPTPGRAFGNVQLQLPKPDFSRFPVVTPPKLPELARDLGLLPSAPSYADQFRGAVIEIKAQPGFNVGELLTEIERKGAQKGALNFGSIVVRSG